MQPARVPGRQRHSTAV